MVSTRSIAARASPWASKYMVASAVIPAMTKAALPPVTVCFTLGSFTAIVPALSHRFPS